MNNLDVIKVDGIPSRWLYRDTKARKVCLPPLEVIVEIQDQSRKPPPAAKVVEGLDVIRVWLEVALWLVPRDLFRRRRNRFMSKAR